MCVQVHLVIQNFTTFSLQLPVNNLSVPFSLHFSYINKQIYYRVLRTITYRVFHNLWTLLQDAIS